MLPELSIFSPPEIAILIDGDWLHYALKRLNREIDYARLWDAFQPQTGPSIPIYFFGSPRSNDKSHDDFLLSLSSLGYAVEISHLVKRNGGYVVKGTEIRIAIRALSLPIEIKSIIFVSGDSEFVPLLEQLKQNGIKTNIITDLPASRNLVKSADFHYSLERFLNNLDRGKGFAFVKSKERKVLPPKNWYIEKGEHLTPYLVIRKLFLSAKTEIILVDPYINDQVLFLVQLLPTSINVHILTNRLTPADFCTQVKKLCQEGYNIFIHITSQFHDRFLGIDNNCCHSGHSFKDLGGKDSLLTKIDDEDTLKKLCARVRSEIENTDNYCL